MTKIVKKDQTEKKYVWAVFLAPNFKKIENPSVDEPLELPYAILFDMTERKTIPASPKCIYVGESFSDLKFARSCYQNALEAVRDAFSVDSE